MLLDLDAILIDRKYLNSKYNAETCHFHMDEI